MERITLSRAQVFSAVFFEHEVCIDPLRLLRNAIHGLQQSIRRDAEKNFTQTFQDGFLKSCGTQARVGLKKAEADRYCQCALEQVMSNWDNDEEAGAALDGLPMLEVQRLLVTPCATK